MQDPEDEFEVKLGRIGNRHAKKATSYLRRVRQEAHKVGVSPRRVSSHRVSSFTGARIGRGYAYGVVLAAHARPAGQRRVVSRTRIVRIKAGYTGAVRAHLRYIQRDGVKRDGQPGELYEAREDRADGRAFTKRSRGDRHQFRFIVAPEDSAELWDLKPFIRDLMRQMEQDLCTKLDWVAADHFNTGHPHTHLVIRGKDDSGNNLIIARHYITHGFRMRAADLITRELGPQTEIEVARKLQHEATAERFTRLDSAILRDTTDGRLELFGKPITDPSRHATRMGRLRTLERMGLAVENTRSHWQIDPELEAKLRRMGERGEIIKIIHRELGAAGLSRAAGSYTIFDPERGDQRLIGRVVGHGFSHELRERRYVVIDGIDGWAYYAEIGVHSANEEPLIRGTIVELRSRGPDTRNIDRTIAKVAARQIGIYSEELHRQVDPQASRAYVDSHVRRLESLRREGMVERLSDDRWNVGADYLDQALRHEALRRSRNPVQIAVLSWQKLEELPRAEGATWLDRQLLAKTSEVLGPTGMGAEVGSALRARRQWLTEQGLAREQKGRVQYARDLLRTLEARELTRAAADISARTGLEHRNVRIGENLTGIYRRTLTLNSGRFALIERSHDFALVPWRPVLERARGHVVTGSVALESVSWSIGIKRGVGR